MVRENETTRFAAVAFTVVGFGFSAYLTYRELFSIHHICEYCVGSAVIVTIVMCLAVWRFLRGAPGSPGTSPAAEPVATEPAAPLGITPS
jgi:uncharacterized membrane protein